MNVNGLMTFKVFVTIMAASEFLHVTVDRFESPNSFTIPSVLINLILDAWVVYFAWAKL